MTTSYKGTFSSSQTNIVFGELEIKDKTQSSALAVMTYRGNFKKNVVIEFPFLIKGGVMQAVLTSGQILKFQGVENEGVYQGSYVSLRPMDSGNFTLQLVEQIDREQAS